MGQGWTEKDVEMMLVSPFATITVSQSLTEEHEPSLSTETWIEINAGLIESLGAKVWLSNFLSILEGIITEDEQVSPYHVINIDPRFSYEHPPMVPKETWIGANAMLIPQLGSKQWLQTLLDILEGDIVGSSEFGNEVPYGYQPANIQPAPRRSFPQGGKRSNKRKKRKK